MGGKSGGVTGYWYRVAYHHGIASTPIDAFLEFRCADKTAWSGEITNSSIWHIEQRNLFGGEQDQGGISSDVEILFGDPDAEPNVYLQTLGQYIATGDGSLMPYLQSIAGAQPPASPTGQVPGWRGVTTFVFRGGYYGANNPYPQKPAYKIRAIKMGWDGDPGDGSACWYPEKAEVIVTGAGSLPEGSTDWDYQAIAFSEPNTEWSDFTPPSDGWQSGGTMPFRTGTGEWPEMRSNLWVRKTVTVTGTNQTLKCAADNGCVLFINGAIIGYSNRDNDPVAHNENYPVVFPVAAGNTYEVMAKAYAEKSAGDDSGNNLDITIEATGLTAMNPAHILYEALTAQDRGAEPVASINDASFRAAADWFYSQGIGLCTQLDPDSETVEQFRERIGKVAGCGVSRSPIDGLWYLDIVNGVYELDSLPILTDDDILEFNETPSILDDAVNSISVEYMDVQTKATVTTPPVQALALVSANGLNHDVHQYHELPTGDLATRFAQRDLQGGITPTRSFDLTTTRKPYGWRVNTYFRLQSVKRGIADMVCVLVEKSSGTLKSGAMKLTAAQDIYSLPTASFVQVETGVDSRPSQIPIPIMQQAAFEAPYFEVARNLSRADLAALPGDAGYLMTVAQSPGGDRDYSIEVSTDGGNTYDVIVNAIWCPTALIVEGDTLTNAAPAAEFTITGGALLTQVAVGSAALWDGEIIRVDAIDATAGTLKIGRGCADTVPEPHAANSRIWFFDGFAGADPTEYTDGETIDLKLLTNTGSAQLDPSLATPLSVTFGQRQTRPYPPANVQLNTEWYPDTTTKPVSVTFNYRDRVSQADQLIDYSAASVGPETGVSYTLRGYIGGTLTDTIADQAASPIAWNPGTGGSARIELVAVRDGIESNLWSHDFTISGTQPWTPANLATKPAVWLNDTSSVTDDGTGHCSQWSDISGNARHFVQATASQRPAIVADGQNGRPMLTFDGVDDWLSGTATCAALTNNIAELSIFAVANPTPSATYKRIVNFSVGGTSSGGRAALALNSNSFDAAQRRSDVGSAANALIAQSDSAWRIIQSEHNWTAATVAARIDGGSATTTDTGQGSGNTAATNSYKVEMGGTIDVGGQYVASSFAEVIVLAYVPSDADRQQIEGYLAYRWGLQANLPADHPYKTNPPTV